MKKLKVLKQNSISSFKKLTKNAINECLYNAFPVDMRSLIQNNISELNFISFLVITFYVTMHHLYKS